MSVGTVNKKRRRRLVNYWTKELHRYQQEEVIRRLAVSSRPVKD